MMSGHELFLCDMKSNLFTRINIGGQLVGWWDEHTLLVHDGTNNLVLRDVTTRQTEPLLSAEEISKLLQKMGLPSRADDIGRARAPWLSSHWNGRAYDFFFTVAKEENWESQFLVKLDRNNRTLNLVKRDFKSHHLGFFDANATHYIYEGENGAPGRGGNGAVYICDLSDDSVRTLVPPDNGGQYSLARFCGDGVIYMHKRVLWRVELDGSNNMPLFQPGEGR